MPALHEPLESRERDAQEDEVGDAVGMEDAEEEEEEAADQGGQRAEGEREGREQPTVAGGREREEGRGGKGGNGAKFTELSPPEGDSSVTTWGGKFSFTEAHSAPEEKEVLRNGMPGIASYLVVTS